MSPIPIRYFENMRPEMLAQLAAFVSIESPSMDKPALDRMGAALRACLRRASFVCERSDSLDVLV